MKASRPERASPPADEDGAAGASPLHLAAAAATSAPLAMRLGSIAIGLAAGGLVGGATLLATRAAGLERSAPWAAMAAFLVSGAFAVHLLLYANEALLDRYERRLAALARDDHLALARLILETLPPAAGPVRDVVPQAGAVLLGGLVGAALSEAARETFLVDASPLLQYAARIAGTGAGALGVAAPHLFREWLGWRHVRDARAAVARGDAGPAVRALRLALEGRHEPGHQLARRVLDDVLREDGAAHARPVPPAAAARARPAAPKVVLFDLDGVLVDSARAWFAIINRGREDWGYPKTTWEEFAPTFGQGVEADVAAFFPRQSIADVTAFFARALPGEAGAIALKDDALRVLDTLRARGLRLAVVTNSPRPLAEEVLARTGIASRIDALAAAGDAPDKPAPDLVLLALRRLGARADEAIYVGDSKTDVAAARAAGVFIVGLGIDGDARIERIDEVPALVA